jgi:isoleucyl-tRNA synthetase
LTDELLGEGMARELVHQIQQLRKEAGFEIADRITVYYEGDAALVRAFQAHRDYVLREVLGRDARAGLPPGGNAVYRKAVRLDGRVLTVGIAQTA